MEKITSNLNRELINIKKCKTRAPINIALIKYWGKSCEKQNLPLNDNISITLDMKNMYTETELTFKLYNSNDSKETPKISLFLNEDSYKVNLRQQNLINKVWEDYFKEYFLEVEIRTINSFPTSAGCASSASGGAALALALYKICSDQGDLSYMSRILSGSACRSINSGIVQWSKDGSVETVFEVDYWKDLRIMLLIVSNKVKDYSSTDGMKKSKETSELLKKRLEIVPEMMSKVKQSIKEKDIEKTCYYIMKDSNNFHAVCRDTFPPLTYMNSTSDFIVKSVNCINKSYDSDEKIKCGYTFDAGPNAWIITTANNVDLIKNFFESLLIKKNQEEFRSISKILEIESDKQEKLYDESIYHSIESIKIFEVGVGVYSV